MGEGILKYLSGKVVGTALAVCGVIIVIWYWRLPPESRDTMWSVARGSLIWAGCVAVLPWGLFFVPMWVVRRFESNLASAVMLAGFLAMDVALALLMAGPITHAWQKAALLFGFLCAAVYNFAVCEFLARRAEDSD